MVFQCTSSQSDVASRLQLHRKVFGVFERTLHADCRFRVAAAGWIYVTTGNDDGAGCNRLVLVPLYLNIRLLTQPFLRLLWFCWEENIQGFGPKPLDGYEFQSLVTDSMLPKIAATSKTLKYAPLIKEILPLIKWQSWLIL